MPEHLIRDTRILKLAARGKKFGGKVSSFFLRLGQDVVGH